jgi:hypothetical protein
MGAKREGRGEGELEGPSSSFLPFFVVDISDDGREGRTPTSVDAIKLTLPVR